MNRTSHAKEKSKDRDSNVCQISGEKYNSWNCDNAVVLTLDLCTTFDYFYTANCGNSIFGVLIKDLQLFQTYFIYVLPPLISPFNCGMNFLPEETTTNFARSIQAFIFIPVRLFLFVFLAFNQVPLTVDEPSTVRRNSRHVTVVLILFTRGRIWRRCLGAFHDECSIALSHLVTRSAWWLSSPL